MRPRPWMLVLLFVIDRYLKNVLWFTPPQGGVFGFLNPMLNRDIAFSLSVPHLVTTFLPYVLCVAAIAIAVVAYWYWKRGDTQWFWWGLITIGALSNVMDRFVIGGVFDYIDLKIWPVFNTSDAFISIGVIFLLYSYIRRKKV